MAVPRPQQPWEVEEEVVVVVVVAVVVEMDHQAACQGAPRRLAMVVEAAITITVTITAAERVETLLHL